MTCWPICGQPAACCRPWYLIMRAFAVLAAALLLAGGLASQLPELRIETAIEEFLQEDDPARVLYDEFFLNRDWPLSSAIAVVLLILLLLPIALLRHYQNKEANQL